MLTYVVHVESVCNLLKRILNHLRTKTFLKTTLEFIVKTLEAYTGERVCTVYELEMAAAETMRIGTRTLTGGLRVVRMDKVYYDVATYINCNFDVKYPERGIAEAWTFYYAFVDYINSAYELPTWFEYIDQGDYVEVVIPYMEKNTDPVEGFRVSRMTRPSVEEVNAVECMLYAMCTNTLDAFIELPTQTSVLMYYELMRIK